MTKEMWLAKNGFNKNGNTYIVFGENTFEIKDYLKDNGCHFNSTIKWHCANPDFELPIGYEFIEFSFDQLYDWCGDCHPSVKADVMTRIAEQQKKYEQPCLSEWVGSIGERLRHLNAVLVSARGFQGKYGYSNVYTFKSGENLFTWFSQTYVDAEIGEMVDLSGTVKDHNEYKNKKSTVLSRCIVKVLA